MDTKQENKKQAKRSTGSRFEVTPIKSPPVPRRLRQFRNSDGSLLFPAQNNKPPYKLRKSEVSNNDKKQTINLDMELITEKTLRYLQCKVCRKSNYNLKTEVVSGVANDLYFECRNCETRKIIKEAEKSIFYKKK